VLGGQRSTFAPLSLHAARALHQLAHKDLAEAANGNGHVGRNRVPQRLIGDFFNICLVEIRATKGLVALLLLLIKVLQEES